MNTLKIPLAFFFAFVNMFVYGQEKRVYLPIWTFHQKNIIVDGISVGLWNFSIEPKNTKTNGIRVSLIGEGLLAPLVGTSPIPDTDSLFQEEEKRAISETINGFCLSGTGNFGVYEINGICLGFIGQLNQKVNGISAAIMMNFAQIHNGVQIALFNECYKMKGIQIGLYNSSKKTKGIQIGLWDVNERRQFPIINWNFRN